MGLLDTALAAAGPPKPPRSPYWLTAQHRADILAAITRLRSSVTVMPHLDRLLDAVQTELSVAEARTQLTPLLTDLMQRLHDLEPDSVPVRFSDDEAAAALALPGLAPETTRHLHRESVTA